MKNSGLFFFRSLLTVHSLILLIVLLSACSPKIKKATEVPSYSMITFGESGGITGAYSAYILQKNGELYRQYRFPNKPYEQKFIRQTNLDSVKIIYQKIKDLDQLKYNTTANVTYSIELHQDSSIHRISWGFEKNDTTQQLREVYQYLKNFAAGKKKD